MSIRGKKTGAGRRSFGAALGAGGTLIALLIGCSTQVEGVDGELGTTEQALAPLDPCLNNPEDPNCNTYDPPAPQPTSAPTWSINTTYWRLDYAGWQFSPGTPQPYGSATSTSQDQLHATFSVTRTSSATEAALGFGAAIVRAIPRPIAGGTRTTSCTKNADCYTVGAKDGSGNLLPAPRVLVAGDPDGPEGGFNYCVKVGTSSVKTCVQRPGPAALKNPSGPPTWVWQGVTPYAAPTSTTAVAYSVPPSGGAPYGNTTPAPTTYGGSPGTDQYSLLLEVNIGQKVDYNQKLADGGEDLRAPCSSWDKINPTSNLAYEEDPTQCAKIVRPLTTLTKWSCGDGTCNGAETGSTCPGDCPCGNGVCSATESEYTCPEDCCSVSKTWCVRFGIDDPDCQACMGFWK